MTDGRVVTANLPKEMVARMDKRASQMERSKSWIIKQAVAEWLAEEDRRDELTWEAIKSVEEGRTFTQEEVEQMLERRKRERRERRKQD
jgi:predicted transcriptional regulator